jgi:hypothetical protein
LEKEEIERLKRFLQERPFWRTKEVQELIKERFGVKLSENQTRRILRNKLKMLSEKPYPTDYRKPKDAEQILSSQFEDSDTSSKRERSKRRRQSIGFLGKTSPQLLSNTVRVWSFDKPR